MSIRNQELGTLLEIRTSLAQALEENPVFQAIQHVEKAIEALRASTPAFHASGSKDTGNIITGALTPQQRDNIANAAIQHFMKTSNASITIKALCGVLRQQGIPLPEAAVSSVGGILGKREMFVKDPAKPGCWKLSDAYYDQHRNSTSRVA